MRWVRSTGQGVLTVGSWRSETTQRGGSAGRAVGAAGSGPVPKQTRLTVARPVSIGASRFEEAFFPKDARVLRQGLTGSGFYVILDGEADVIADGKKRATLARGEFFGEVSVLLGEPPIADVVATRPLRCIVLGGPAVEGFLVDHPRVMYRMLQAQARRLRGANQRFASE